MCLRRSWPRSIKELSASEPYGHGEQGQKQRDACGDAFGEHDARSFAAAAEVEAACR